MNVFDFLYGCFWFYIVPAMIDIALLLAVVFILFVVVSFFAKGFGFQKLEPLIVDGKQVTKEQFEAAMKNKEFLKDLENQKFGMFLMIYEKGQHNQPRLYFLDKIIIGELAWNKIIEESKNRTGSKEFYDFMSARINGFTSPDESWDKFSVSHRFMTEILRKRCFEVVYIALWFDKPFNE